MSRLIRILVFAALGYLVYRLVNKLFFAKPNHSGKANATNQDSTKIREEDIQDANFKDIKE